MSAAKKKPRSKSAATVLVMRTCAADLTSKNGFVWPKRGHVACKDWQPTKECGNGLHGLLWGVGDGSLLNWSADAMWLVVRVRADSVIDLGGKVKFPCGQVVYCGDRHGAAKLIAEHAPAGSAIVSGTATAGYSGTATAGYRGTATAGVSGTATAGVRGTATAGVSGTATAGYRGTATAGDSGTATAGDSGTATAGYRGTATAGVSGTATAGYRGTATAGEFGVLAIEWYDSKRAVWRKAVAEIDGDKLKPRTPYHLDEHGAFVEGEHPDAKGAREYAAKISAMEPGDLA